MRTTRLSLRYVLVLALAFVISSGCTVIEQLEKSPMTSRIVTDQLTLRFIAGAENPAFRAADVRRVVDELRDKIDVTEQVTLADLEATVSAAINWEALSPADRDLLRFALQEARVTLTNYIGFGVIDPAGKQTVGTFLDWIDQAAMRAQ